MASTNPGTSAVNSNQVIHLEDDVRSEAGFEESGMSSIRLIHLLENLFVLGMTSLDKWEVGLNFMKTHPDVTSHPILLQIWFTLNQLFLTFSNHVYAHADPSCDKLPYFTSEDKSFEEITTILKPMLNKKPLKEKAYPYDIVQKVLNVFRSASLLPGTDSGKESGKVEKKRKNNKNDSLKKQKKSRKHSIASSSSSSDSSSTSSYSSSESEDSDSQDKFGKLFSQSKNKKTKNVVIKQTLQYNDGQKRRKITTPGETGSHLIKIEITDTRDLKKCSSEKTYWQQVSKKGVFLLNTKTSEEDKAIFKDIDNILVKIGQQISKVKNVKHEQVSIDWYSKKKQ